PGVPRLPAKAHFAARNEAKGLDLMLALLHPKLRRARNVYKHRHARADKLEPKHSAFDRQGLGGWIICQLDIDLVRGYYEPHCASGNGRCLARRNGETAERSFESRHAIGFAHHVTRD